MLALPDRQLVCRRLSAILPGPPAAICLRAFLNLFGRDLRHHDVGSLSRRRGAFHFWALGMRQFRQNPQDVGAAGMKLQNAVPIWLRLSRNGAGF